MWWKVLLGLLAVWLVFSVVGAVAGFLIKGVFWLAVIGGVGVAAAAAIGWAKDKDRKKLPR